MFTVGRILRTARAWIPNSVAVQASTATNVTLDPVEFTQALIASTRRVNIADATLSASLLQQLNLALVAFQQGWNQTGEDTLRAYVQQVNGASGIGVDTVSRLVGQVNVLFGCIPIGFSLGASPASATVTAGNTASYTISITPTGGFTGNVLMGCAGVPTGAGCSVSPSSVAVHEATQVMVTVTTSSRSSSAGFAGLPSGRARWEWLAMLLLTLLATALLRRERLRHNILRQSILGSMLLLAILSVGLNGCGSSGSGLPGTPAGSYTLTVTAASGNTSQKATLTLVVH
jgi:hypothetical protein